MHWNGAVILTPYQRSFFANVRTTEFQPKATELTQLVGYAYATKDMFDTYSEALKSINGRGLVWAEKTWVVRDEAHLLPRCSERLCSYLGLRDGSRLQSTLEELQMDEQLRLWALAKGEVEKEIVKEYGKATKHKRTKR